MEDRAHPGQGRILSGVSAWPQGRRAALGRTYLERWTATVRLNRRRSALRGLPSSAIDALSFGSKRILSFSEAIANERAGKTKVIPGRRHRLLAQPVRFASRGTADALV